MTVVLQYEILRLVSSLTIKGVEGLKQERIDKVFASFPGFRPTKHLLPAVSFVQFKLCLVRPCSARSFFSLNFISDSKCTASACMLSHHLAKDLIAAPKTGVAMSLPFQPEIQVNHNCSFCCCRCALVLGLECMRYRLSRVQLLARPRTRDRMAGLAQAHCLKASNFNYTTRRVQDITSLCRNLFDAPHLDQGECCRNFPQKTIKRWPKCTSVKEVGY